MKQVYSSSSKSSLSDRHTTIKEKKGKSKGALIQEGYLFDILWHARGWVHIIKWLALV